MGLRHKNAKKFTLLIQHSPEKKNHPLLYQTLNKFLGIENTT